jgi:FdhD protein
MEPLRRISRAIWRGNDLSEGERAIPEETAIAFTYNGSSYAVMMATPQDLEDFACGFSLTEEIVSSPEEIEKLDIIESDLGVELRMWLTKEKGDAFIIRKRRLAGPTGCGLCGLETLNDAMRPAPSVQGDVRIEPAEIMTALDALAPAQKINHETRAVHAAAFWKKGEGIVALREDVGRHNALDKLAGALARDEISPRHGFVVLTSRISVEMVQKSAAIGVAVIVAVSAPTALAVRTADAAGITLAAIARKDGFEVFTHPHRVLNRASSHVA